MIRNADIVTLVKAGLSADLITLKIGMSSCQFDTSADALAVLRAVGVPDAVIRLMIEAAAKRPLPAGTAMVPDDPRATNGGKSESDTSVAKDPTDVESKRPVRSFRVFLRSGWTFIGGPGVLTADAGHLEWQHETKSGGERNKFSVAWGDLKTESGGFVFDGASVHVTLKNGWTYKFYGIDGIGGRQFTKFEEADKAAGIEHVTASEIFRTIEGFKKAEIPR